MNTNVPIVTNGTPITKDDNLVTVWCDLEARGGHPTQVLERDLVEQVAGVWGNIPCCECGKPINDAIKSLVGAQADIQMNEPRVGLAIRTKDWNQLQEASLNLAVAANIIRKTTTGK